MKPQKRSVTSSRRAVNRPNPKHTSAYLKPDRARDGTAPVLAVRLSTLKALTLLTRGDSIVATLATVKHDEAFTPEECQWFKAIDHQHNSPADGAAGSSDDSREAR